MTCKAGREKSSEVPGTERKGKGGMARQCGRTLLEAMPRGQANQSYVKDGAPGTGSAHAQVSPRLLLPEARGHA